MHYAADKIGSTEVQFRGRDTSLAVIIIDSCSLKWAMDEWKEGPSAGKEEWYFY
jgi:hypothetical protein